jgi:hypothetical protein
MSDSEARKKRLAWERDQHERERRQRAERERNDPEIQARIRYASVKNLGGITVESVARMSDDEIAAVQLEKADIDKLRRAITVIERVMRLQQ